MLRRLKLEICCLSRHIAVIGLGAFLCAIGGILLWINGGSGWYVLNSVSSAHHTHSLTLIFLIWLIIYALYGVRLALLAVGEGIPCSDQKRTLTAFALTSFAYLLDLVWYALFFCTRLTVFSLIVLLSAALLNAVVILISKRGMILATLLHIFVFTAQIAFVCFTVSYLLLN